MTFSLDVAHPHPLIRSLSENSTHAKGRCPEIPQINLEPVHLPACLSPLPLPLPPSSSTAPFCSASACGACCGSVPRKDNMPAPVSSPPAGEEKQEAAPIRHCKGINDLDKVVLHEVRGSFALVLVCHSRESPGMFRLLDPGANPRGLPWCCSKSDFLVVALAFPFPMLHMYVSNVSDVSDVYCNCFILTLQK